jgi:hypothetical protein
MYKSVNESNEGVFNILVRTLSEKKMNPIQPPSLEKLISQIGEEHNFWQFETSDKYWLDAKEHADALAKIEAHWALSCIFYRRDN